VAAAIIAASPLMLDWSDIRSDMSEFGLRRSAQVREVTGCWREAISNGLALIAMH